MRIDPAEIGQANTYKLIAGSIVPRPIAWVSTVDAAGVANLAPFSFFNGIGSNPPALSISIMHDSNRAVGKKDTLHNIETTGQFVVNLVSAPLLEAMNITAADFPVGINEFVAAGLEAAPSERVRAPRVAQALVSFECERFASVPVGEGPGSATLVIGRILLMHMQDSLVDERYRVDVAQLQPVARLAGNYYATLSEQFLLARPRFNPETGKLEPTER